MITKRPKSLGHETNPNRGYAEEEMKRGIAVLLSLSALLVVGYFTASKWAIRHDIISLRDPERNNRPVELEIAVRRDKLIQAENGLIKLPVAILNHGNTVKHTEYSFLANAFAARGYLVIAPQHDLATDPPMVTKPGELYVGRLPQIQRGVANIKFAVEEMRKIQPNADYDSLTMGLHRWLCGIGFRDLGIAFARIALGDGGNGALGRALLEIFGEQAAHVATSFQHCSLAHCRVESPDGQ